MGKEPIPGYTGLKGPWVTGEPALPWYHCFLGYTLVCSSLLIHGLMSFLCHLEATPHQKSHVSVGHRHHALNSYFTVPATSSDWTFVFYHMPCEVIFTVCCCTFKVCGVHSNRCFHDWKADRPYVYCRYKVVWELHGSSLLMLECYSFNSWPIF